MSEAEKASERPRERKRESESKITVLESFEIKANEIMSNLIKRQFMGLRDGKEKETNGKTAKSRNC